MNNYLNKYNIKVKRIEYYSNYIIVYSDHNNYFIQKKNTYLEEVFAYFENIQFTYYQDIINSYQDEFYIFPYIEDKTNDIPLKCKEILFALISLHLKSIYVVEISQDEFKSIYEDILKRINQLTSYYLDLHDSILEYEFPRLDYYYFLRNINLFLRALRVAYNNLELWYKENELKVRKSMIIGNVSLNNFRVCEKSYFLDFSECRKDIFIYDLVSFYKKEWMMFDISSFLSIYQSKITFSLADEYLFYTLICIPDKISFSKNSYQNIMDIQNNVLYLQKTLSFVLEEDKNNQEAD